MTYQFFTLEFSRMTKNYGDKAYPQDRVDQIWKRLQDLPEALFRDLLGELIAYNLHPPMLDKIELAARPYVDRAMAVKRDRLRSTVEREGWCRWCQNSGILMARLRDYSHPAAPYTFRCSSCSAWRILGLSERLILWREDLLARYWPMLGNQCCDPDDAPEPEPVAPRAAPPPPVAPPYGRGVGPIVTSAVKEIPRVQQDSFDL